MVAGLVVGLVVDELVVGEGVELVVGEGVGLVGVRVVLDEAAVGGFASSLG